MSEPVFNDVHSKVLEKVKIVFNHAVVAHCYIWKVHFQLQLKNSNES